MKKIKNFFLMISKVTDAKVLATIILVTAQPAFAVDIPAARCNESVFKPCICPSVVPEDIKFRPKLAACGGKAAVILSGDWAGSYSVVLRDRQNRDRYPSSGYNGCSAAEAGGESPPNRCSAFKVQKKIRKGSEVIHCFGNRGTDKILAKASRLTIKLKDVPGSSSDPLARVCLQDFSAKVNLN